MRNRVSVLSAEQRTEMVVENFVYHIIKADLEEPEYLDEVVLSSESQKDFFKGVISETAQGTQYVFSGSASTSLAENCRAILENPDDEFLERSKLIAADFLRFHTGATSEGVLIVARVTIPIGTVRQSLLALIKLDYSPVLRQRRSEEDSARVTLEEVVEALSEHKGFVQKRALIDTSDVFRWDVLAVERKKTAIVMDSEDAISDYFKRFLDVRLFQNDSSITKKLVAECHRWAKSYDGDLSGRTAADIRHKVIALFEANENVQLEYDQIKSAVCTHQNEMQMHRMATSFDRHMADAGYAGISFSPKPRSISSSDRKGVWETDAGIQIVWMGERNENILKKERNQDGGYVITIKATSVTEKS